MAFGDLKALDARLQKMTKEIVSDEATKKVANAVGLMGKAHAHSFSGKAALGGDFEFSGWPKPGQLEVRYSLSSLNPGLVVIHRAPRSAGPWRVAEEGRNQGNASGFSGPGVSNKSGLTARTKSGGIRKVRARKGRAWNGKTEGHGSWTAFENVVTPKISPLVAKEVRAALGRAVIG